MDVMPCLSLLRYKDIPKEKEEQLAWLNSISKGEMSSLYPILNWSLSNLPSLKRRIYLAPFLTPIQLPLEVSMKQGDDTLINLSQRYKMFQDEFKTVHKEYEEAVKKTESDKADTDLNIRRTTKELQEEKQQLLDKIESIRTSASPDFLSMYDATSALRKEHDKEMQLHLRLEEQKTNLEFEKARLKKFRRRYNTLKCTVGVGGTSIDTILEEIKKEVAETTMMVRSDLVSQHNDIKRKIEAIEREKDQPSRSEEDLNDIRSKREELEEECQSKAEMLEREEAKASHQQISIFKQVRKAVC